MFLDHCVDQVVREVHHRAVGEPHTTGRDCWRPWAAAHEARRHDRLSRAEVDGFVSLGRPVPLSHHSLSRLKGHMFRGRPGCVHLDGLSACGSRDRSSDTRVPNRRSRRVERRCATIRIGRGQGCSFSRAQRHSHSSERGRPAAGIAKTGSTTRLTVIVPLWRCGSSAAR